MKEKKSESTEITRGERPGTKKGQRRGQEFSSSPLRGWRDRKNRGQDFKLWGYKEYQGGAGGDKHRSQ